MLTAQSLSAADSSPAGGGKVRQGDNIVPIEPDGTFTIGLENAGEPFVLEGTAGFVDKTTYFNSRTPGDKYYRIPDDIDLEEFERAHRRDTEHNGSGVVGIRRVPSSFVEGTTRSFDYFWERVPDPGIINNPAIPGTEFAIQIALDSLPQVTNGQYPARQLEIVDSPIDPEPGRIVFRHNPEISFGGLATITHRDEDGVSGGLIEYLRAGTRGATLFMHELGHLFAFPGHRSPGTCSIMSGLGVTPCRLSSWTPEDELFAAIALHLRIGNTAPDNDPAP